MVDIQPNNSLERPKTKIKSLMQGTSNNSLQRKDSLVDSSDLGQNSSAKGAGKESRSGSTLCLFKNMVNPDALLSKKTSKTQA